MHWGVVGEDDEHIATSFCGCGRIFATNSTLYCMAKLSSTWLPSPCLLSWSACPSSAVVQPAQTGGGAVPCIQL